MNPELVIFFACVTFAIAGAVQGLTGFGFAIVGMALLPLMMDFQLAFSIVALASIVIPGVTLFQTRKGMKGGPHWPLTIGCMLGIMIGFWCMDRFSSQLIFIRIFGVVLIGFAITDAILTRKMENFSMPGWLGWPLGWLGGFFGGAFNVGGPPLVVFVYSQDWSKERIIAVLQIAFICATSVRLVAMGTEGYFGKEVLVLAAWTFPATIVGIILGYRLMKRVKLTHLKTGVFIAVALLGLKYVFDP